jgi:beta-xylosidase
MSQQLQRLSFAPGEPWLDTDGNPIQAHGGGILSRNGVYYWYGEHKAGPTKPTASVGFRVDVIGMACYSSTDLVRWQNERIVLPAVEDDPHHDLHPSKVLERPKVIYHEGTGKYVMWMHVDTEDYQYARAGVAVSDSPTGPFTYLGSERPNDAMSRDMTLFQDDDGKAYLVYASEHNATLYISLLTDDYLHQSGTYTKNFPNQYREAPAIFKHHGKYFLISSGCTGWDANAAEYAVADSPLGPWTAKGNPCQGVGAEITFQAQSTFVLPVAGRYIFMADRWQKEDLADSRYVWLPIEMTDDRITIRWYDRWEMSSVKP